MKNTRSRIWSIVWQNATTTTGSASSDVKAREAIHGQIRAEHATRRPLLYVVANPDGERNEIHRFPLPARTAAAQA